MYYSVCGMMRITDPLLLIERIAHEVVAAGFLLQIFYHMSNIM